MLRSTAVSPGPPDASLLAALGTAAAALAGALLLHTLVWRLGRRLPLVWARRAGRRRALPPDAHLRWRGTVELALLPLKAGLYVAAAWIATEQFPALREARAELGAALAAALGQPLFAVKGRPFTAVDLLALPLALAGLWLAASATGWLFKGVLLRPTPLEPGVKNGLAALLRYALLFLGALVILQAWGIEPSALAVFGSLLGVGIGFGLQTIANNFVSGLLIGLERPIKPGDFVEVGRFSGTVERIGARSTVVRTQDRVSILIPNSRFLETEVINWSHGDPVSRVRVPVPVAYGTSPARVRTLLLEVARGHPDVLAEPSPEVDLSSFGDSALLFELQVWTRDPRRQSALRSELNYALEAALRRAGLEIPYPRRDLRLRASQFDRLAELLGRQALGEAAGDAPLIAGAGEAGAGEEETAVVRRRAWTDEDLAALATRLRGPGGVEIRDRRHLLNVYPRCLVGREAVDWLVAREGLSRREAVRAGRLLVERGLLHHVLDEHPFADGPLFYRFRADEAAPAAVPE